MQPRGERFFGGYQFGKDGDFAAGRRYPEGFGGEAENRVLAGSPAKGRRLISRADNLLPSASLSGGAGQRRTNIANSQLPPGPFDRCQSWSGRAGHRRDLRGPRPSGSSARPVGLPA